MSVPAGLADAVGAWVGDGTLYTPWRSPAENPYASTASIRPFAKGFLRLEYTWSLEGESHQGLLLLTDAKEDGAVAAVWIDSWHQSQTFLLSSGDAEREGRSVTVVGSYPAPPDPDWRWRTVVSLDGDHLEIVMYNIMPTGEEALAVRNVYRRQS